MVDLVTCQSELFSEVFPFIQMAMCVPLRKEYYMNQLSLTIMTYKSRLNRNEEVIERISVQVRQLNANAASTKNKSR